VADDSALSLADFDRYVEEHNVQPGEYGAAFAQLLAEVTEDRCRGSRRSNERRRRTAW
jgi:hypothetical protein